MSWHSHIIRQEPLGETAREAKEQYLAADAPVTLTLIWIVAAVFAGEVALSVLLGTQSIRVLAVGSFKLHPEIAWLAAPVLHAGFGHVLTNIGGLAILGIPLEQHFSKRQFGIFVIVTAYLSTAIGGVFIAAFTADQVAMYGISGTVYAMAGVAIVQFCSSRNPPRGFEWIALLLAISAAVTVVLDPFTGPFFHPDWINGGHTGGLVTGLIVGLLH
ncbi:rhomboid family intramembrane serine protease [Halonotius terrestris]|uniref:Rhomboid family intramembrane serine protease n=1 Tax=Halonotius terrestris TaxID=2487750 RepID=A0A8J8P799_9EURY|nr:rhomboid family intramembrane serine protease [Halonotius terrestris]TQQ79148.1 rhomboid family intramembrane serine protease [Halonotius terrestris]